MIRRCVTPTWAADALEYRRPNSRRDIYPERCLARSSPILNGLNRSRTMLKFLGSTIGIIFLIGLLVVIGIFSLIF